MREVERSSYDFWALSDPGVTVFASRRFHSKVIARGITVAALADGELFGRKYS
jgi:hypothetical protein